MNTAAAPELFAAAAIGAYGFPPNTQVRLVSMSENATFLVGSIVGNDVPLGVLRVYRHDYQCPDAVCSELAWIDALRADGVVKTPAVQRTVDGQAVRWITINGITRACAVFDYVAGENPTPDDIATYQLVGSFAAALHRHAEQWVRPAWFTRRTWDVESILGAGAPWGQWAAGPGLDTDGVALLNRADARVRRELASYPTAAPAGGLVHCDLRDANLLKDAEGQVWVIDFDDIGFSWYLWDLSSGLTLQEHLPNVGDLASAWLGGYRQLRSLTARDVAAVPDLVFLRRLHVLAWLGSHPESDIANNVGDSYTLATYDLAEKYLNGRFLNDL